MDRKETTPTFMERVTAVHTIMNANKNMAGNVVNSDSNTADYKPRPASNSVVRPTSDKTSEIKRALADLCVVTRTDNELNVENCLNT